MRTTVLLALAAGLSALPSAAVTAPPPASAWTVGPIVHGQSRSRGLPLRPQSLSGGAIAVRVPGAPGSLHGLTIAPPRSLAGARRLTLRYRIEAAPGARIVPRTDPRLPALITFFIQRRGDDWSARGPFETYRWYATFATQTLDTGPGERVMTVPLNANWTAILTSSARTNPAAFAAAKAEASAVGVVLGGGDGFGHGIQSQGGPARLVITDFRVE